MKKRSKALSVVHTGLTEASSQEKAVQGDDISGTATEVVITNAPKANNRKRRTLGGKTQATEVKQMVDMCTFLECRQRGEVIYDIVDNTWIRRQGCLGPSEMR